MFDCRFDLADADAGGHRYAEGHIPGAAYLHLNIDLSGPVEPGRTGRHPLPERGAFAALLAQHGVTDETQVVAYDDMGGMFAARLWWMVRWTGHCAVAVLDGGQLPRLNRLSRPDKWLCSLCTNCVLDDLLQTIRFIQEIHAVLFPLRCGAATVVNLRCRRH